ncbi:MAG: carboxylating nicotinate-nucleotide diphosphorylase [Parvularcula sp.]|jgi:nicotinate-nucleotide pyrophosphorylase (carboxylating)|nr:carboxylating nicotinate-nucleotide diphosphorylase [Parvularcula sp.]
MRDELPRAVIRELVRTALLEDVGQGADVTSIATMGAETKGKAVIRARSAGVLCGLPLAEEVFRQIDPALSFRPALQDGDDLTVGQDVLSLEGSARSLLLGERTALNFLGHLSGIASLTARYVKAVEGKAAIAATRKTLPGLRFVQKYAVRCGGGLPHRLSLSDCAMIKDNHIAAAGSISEAIRRVRAYAGHTVKVEVEVDRLDQLLEALTASPDIVLLDNMTPEELRQVVEITNGRAILEASGGVTLETAPSIAESGVDVISVGALTHSAPNLDLGMDWIS